MNTSRRDFFIFSGSALTGAALTAGEDAHASTPPPLSILQEKNLSADVLVAGGGLAGVCAAIAAARNGAKVILVQDRSRLGGNSCSEIRMHVCGANHSKDLALWRETGIIEELKLTESATNPQRSFEVWDLLLYDKIVSEPNITLLLDTSVVAAAVEGNLVKSVTAISPLIRERIEITAKCCIDCTGDAALATAADAHIMRGREGRNVYGESLAPEQSDHKTMGNTLMFFARRHDRPMPFKAFKWARTFTREDFAHRSIRSWEYGYWWLEWGGELDTIADNRRIRHELVRVLLGVWDYIKNSGNHPDSENWALEWVGMIPGKRESLRVVGPHIMLQQELERAEPYPDRVAYGGWPMDDHPPGGIDSRAEAPCTQIPFKEPYNIPLRSLYSANRPNLFMAGRNLSASHVALTSTRVMATCAAMGQAAGTAAAYCAARSILPRDITAHDERMSRLQQLLLRDDQAVLRITNEDPDDLARNARISSSSETDAGPADAVIDGYNRDIGDGKPHQWQGPMPDAWLQLDWEAPQSIATVQLTFDTGLNRQLFLSGEDSVYFRQTRGRQPETIADYVLEARIEGTWRTIAKAEDNYLRLVRHKVYPILTQSLRIKVLRTHGDALARIFEVRCYP